MSKRIKIVGVTTSARETGTGSLLCNSMLNQVEQCGAETELINLYSEKLEFCTGCFKCMSTGSCYINDSFEEIKQKIYQADGIIFCAPTYGGTYNAVMKNFIDRLGMFEVLTSSLAGKYLVCISTAGSERSAYKTAKQIAKTLGNGCFGRSYITKVKGFSTRPDDNDNPKRKDIKPNYQEEAKRIGKDLVEDIKSAKSYPLQNFIGRIMARFIMKPVFKRFIVNNKEQRTRAVYENLINRDLI